MEASVASRPEGTSRLGRWFEKTFKDVGRDERRGYRFWGPIALVIVLLELLGLGKVASFDRWPTISTTIGQLQDRDSRWGLLVVALVALAAYYAVRYTKPPERAEPERFRCGPVRIHYNWPLVYGITLLSVGAALVFLDDRIQRGYLIYGVLAVFGILVPLVLARWGDMRKHVAFPDLFYTFACLRERFRFITGIAVALLAILLLHLALYPWPNLARESARHAGLTARQAQTQAVGALETRQDVKPLLKFSTSQRAVANGENAWLVHFLEQRGETLAYTGCYVVVAKGRKAQPTGKCLTP